MLDVQDLEIIVAGFDLGPLTFTVSDGEYFVLLGPSGSGKTMLMEWMAGFHGATRGTLRVGNVESSALPPQERGLAIVYQDAALFPHMSVRDNLSYPLRVRHWEAERIANRVDELAALLQINHRLDARPARLSGGEARRVGLGRALAAGQKTLLLDEPLTGLEPGLRRELRHEIAQLHRELGLTVFHITHDLDEARALADRVGLLVQGRLAQVGTLADLSERPASDVVARFMAE
jgi:ABC-type sugar transport system ATPase subunit